MGHKCCETLRRSKFEMPSFGNERKDACENLQISTSKNLSLSGHVEVAGTGVEVVPHSPQQ